MQQNWKKTFYTIWTGQAFSQLSSSILQFAIVWYLTDKTKSGLVLSSNASGISATGLTGPVYRRLHRPFESKNNYGGLGSCDLGCKSVACICISGRRTEDLVDSACDVGKSNWNSFPQSNTAGNYTTACAEGRVDKVRRIHTKLTVRFADSKSGIGSSII